MSTRYPKKGLTYIRSRWNIEQIRPLEINSVAIMAEEQLSDQQIITMYKAMRAEVRQLSEKIGELEVESAEHVRVIATLKDLPPTRKAYRMVGGVLVERTVQEVLPAVTANHEGIQQVLAQLNEQIKSKEASANAWQTKYNIQVQQ